MKINKLRLQNKTKYLIISSENYKDEDSFLDDIAKKLNNGLEILILNEKHFSTKKVIKIAKKIRELCSIYNVIFIICDRLDIVQITEADGIHLFEESVNIEIARDFLGENKIIGKTMTNKEEVISATNNGFDYIIYNSEFKAI